MRLFKSASRLCALIAVLGSISVSARASEVLFGYSGGSQRTDGGVVAGFSFNTFNFPVGPIQSLGFFDYNQDGLIGSYQVGIWDSSQNLLAQGTVTPSSPLIGEFRYVGISPVSLAPNSTYTIAALLPQGTNDVWLDNATYVVFGPGYGGSGNGQDLVSNVLAYPTNFETAPFVIVNASDAAVPEPASLGLIATGGAMLLRRRSRQ